MFRDQLERARRLVALELDLAETRRRLAEDNLKITEAQLELAEREIEELKAENERLRRRDRGPPGWMKISVEMPSIGRDDSQDDALAACLVPWRAGREKSQAVAIRSASSRKAR